MRLICDVWDREPNLSMDVVGDTSMVNPSYKRQVDSIQNGGTIGPLIH